MGKRGTHLATTTSLCPECLERVSGEYEARNGSVYLSRTCPDHGDFDREVWESVEHWNWAERFEPDADFDPEGEYTVADDHAGLAVVEVTQDCNLSCSYCFASSGPGGAERTYEEVLDLLEAVLDDCGPIPIQFSGGEPTVRDDLPALVVEAVSMGFEHVQINTNGIRLADEEGYARELAEAGVTAIYLQFDGFESETYGTIRGVDLVESKHATLDACREAGISVVLVPTVVPGVNDHEMGAIVEFALGADIVESVNFQPVAHFGRVAERRERFSLDEAARRLAEQFDAIAPRDLMPIPCCSAYCHTATALLRTGDGVVPITRFLSEELFATVAGSVDETDWMDLIACTSAGKESASAAGSCCSPDWNLIPAMFGDGLDSHREQGSDGESSPVDPGALLEDVLPVSFTGFMDADAADAG